MKTILFLATLCVFAGNSSAAEDVTKPLIFLSGADSKVTKESYDRITTADEWEKTWIQHLGTSKDDYYRPLMEIDFSRCMVIAIFRGKQIQVRQVEVNSISEQKGSLIVRFTELQYSIGAIGKMPEPEYKNPYAFIVLPKNDKELILEVGRIIKGRKVKTEWQEVIRLEPNGKKVKVGPGTSRVLGPVKPDSGN
jgi:hypothetical protein